MQKKNLLYVLIVLFFIIGSCTRVKNGTIIDTEEVSVAEPDDPPDDDEPEEDPINEYSVSLHFNNGSDLMRVVVEENAVIVLPESPTYENYVFVGWFYESTFKRLFNPLIPINQDLNLFAKWTTLHTVTFHFNNEIEATQQVVEENNIASEPRDPTREEYIFGGWYVDNNTFQQPYNFFNPVTESVELYARWFDEDAVLLSVTFNTNGGNEITPLIVAFGSVIVEPKDPTRENFLFEGWYTDEFSLVNAYDFTSQVNQNITLYARWNNISSVLIDVTFWSVGGSEVDNVRVQPNSTVSAPPNPTREGYIFRGWYLDRFTLSRLYDFASPVNNTIELFAQWVVEGTPPQFVVTFNSNGGSDIADKGANYNTTIKEPLPPIRDGYTFLGWFTEPNLKKVFNFSEVISSNISLYAGWAVNSYNVIFNSNGGSDIEQMKVTYNTSLSAPSPPTREGYVFRGWYIDNNTFRNPYNFFSPVTGAITLYADWAPNGTSLNTITFFSNGGQSITPIIVESGEQINAPEDPVRLGYTFEGWYTDNNTFEASFNFSSNINTNIDLYAKWDIDVYVVTFHSNGGSQVNQQNIIYFQTVTKPEDPTNNQAGIIGFDGWYIDEELETEYDFSTPVSANISLYAKWAYIVTYDLASKTITGLNPNLEVENIDLIIPGVINNITMTDIADNAFRNYTGILDVTFPNSIQRIGDGAFYNCRGMSSAITFPSGLEEIGKTAFYNCINIKGELRIPDNVTLLEDEVFYNCINIRGLNISNSVTYIGDRAFTRCHRIDGLLTLPSTLRYIGDEAFSGCANLDGNLIIPNLVTHIGDDAFKGCYNFNGFLTLSSTLERIGDGAFSGCFNLDGDLVIPHSVTHIGNRAFYLCARFDRIVLSNNIMQIGDEAFAFCSSIQGGIVIPASIKSIGRQAFRSLINVPFFRFTGNHTPTFGDNIFADISIIRIFIPRGSIGGYINNANISQYSLFFTAY